MKSATLPDGFFLGQVPPNWTEYLQNGTWSDAHNNRVKVRIPGKHSKGPEILDKDLPWAIVSQSTSAGNRNGASTGLSGGEWVIGFYLDEDEQLPVIMQVLGKNEVSGIKIKASENGTTQFRDTSRFSSFIAPATMLKGGPKPNAAAVPSKEDFEDAKQSLSSPEEAEAARLAAEGQTKDLFNNPNVQNPEEAPIPVSVDPEPTGDIIDPSAPDTRTPAQIQADSAAQRERINEKQTVGRALTKARGGGGTPIGNLPGGLGVNQTPTPSELAEFESNGYRYIPGSGAGGRIVKKTGQNYG
jgi:hypothetical protein